MPVDACDILYLADFAALGGGETSLLHFLDELPRQAPLLRAGVVLAQRGALFDLLVQRGLPLEHIPYPLCFRRGPLPAFSFSALARLTRLIRASGAKLVCANGPFGLLYGGLAARRAGVPLIWTCHGWYEVAGPFKRLLARALPAHIACVSSAVRAAAAAAAPRQSISVDYLGIPPFASPPGSAATRAAIRAELAAGDRLLIGAIGSFLPVKGQLYLLQALPRVLQRLPNAHLLLIGAANPTDPEQLNYKALLEQQVDALQLQPHVTFLGFRSDARRLLRGLDLLVVPSERETFSMVSVEGLEAGIPVIGPDGDGPREIIAAPQCGLRFEPKHAADLAEKILALLPDPAAAGFDPAAGPRRFAELFTAAAHVRRSLTRYAAVQPLLQPVLPDSAPPPA